MAAKRTTKKTQRSGPPPSATPEGRFTVLMEQVQEQNRATIEAVLSLDQKFDRRLSEFEQRTKRDFESVGAALRMNSDLIRQSSDDIVGLKASVDGLAEQMRSLTARVERIENFMALHASGLSTVDLEARIRRIEERLGLTP